ncbi:MAG: AAA family ATPase [Ignavibacteria bacterium]|nr:AAA family ATPase [Ignavibacteria bacterium]
MIIGISGRINSGKTTLAKYLSKSFEWKCVGFGDYIRYIIKEKNVTETRENLQKFGQSLVDNHLDSFCRGILNFIEWDGKENLIIEGIRHTSVLNKIKELSGDEEFLFVYISTSNNQLMSRKNQLSTKQLGEKYEQHKMEIETIFELPKLADVLIDGESSIEESFKIISVRLTSHN